MGYFLAGLLRAFHDRNQFLSASGVRSGSEPRASRLRLSLPLIGQGPHGAKLRGKCPLPGQFRKQGCFFPRRFKAQAIASIGRLIEALAQGLADGLHEWLPLYLRRAYRPLQYPAPAWLVPEGQDPFCAATKPAPEEDRQ